MVDFRLLLYPDIIRRTGSLRRRCRSNKGVSCNLERSCSQCLCGPTGKYDDDVFEDGDDEEFTHSIKRYIIGAVAVLVVLGILVVAYYTGAFNSSENSPEAQNGKEPPLTPANPTKSLPPSSSILRVFKRAAVCADSVVCASVGKDILEKNGTAADAAIATLFCNGVVTMQSMGLGGGFLMTIYKRDEKKAYFLNAREKAPLASTNEIYKSSEMTSRSGPLAIGVPGELRGYWELHKKFGTLPWKDLVQPAIDVCNKGYIMTKHQYMALFKNDLKKYKDSTFKEWFEEKNGDYKKVGSRIVPSKLCRTLSIIADNGGDDLYNGTLSKMFLEDVKKINGIITAEDLQQYNAQWMEPVSVKFRNEDTLYTAPPPGAGAILSFILGILDGYEFNRTSIEDINSTVLTYHRMIEAFKYAYAKRTELGDTNFVDIKNLLSNLTSPKYAESIRKRIMDNTTFQDPSHYGAVYYQKDQHGTAHISIIDQNGDAISVTSSINIYFGNGRVSEQTGIIYNSVMDDFSFPYFKNYFGLPGSPNNEMKPGKRPLSSMCPTIIVDKNGDAKMVVGASGGTVITSSVAWTIIRSLWFGENIKEAVDAPRIHHQLYPMNVFYEYGVLQQVLDGLKSLGHQLHRNLASIICGLRVVDGKITANSDHRKGGDVFGLV